MNLLQQRTCGESIPDARAATGPGNLPRNSPTRKIFAGRPVHPCCDKKARIPRRARAGGGQPSAPGREFCSPDVQRGSGTLIFSGVLNELPFS